MTLNLNLPEAESQLSPRITVIGVGGAGGNAVNNMIQANLEGVDFLVANTDAQALSQSLCEQTIQIGRNITQGLGAGSRPEVGRAAAEESLDEILAALEDVNMVFITAGMGGGTGTGAAPVIARATRDSGILTVGVTTKPFQFEGVHRMRIAETGLCDLQQYVDTLIIIPNQNLFRVANEKTTFADAFKMADDVLHAGVRGVTDLIVMPGLINLDFADIRTVMGEMGKAMMGTGEAEGENRAIEAAEAAISNPLLDDVSMKGAHGVLINITGGDDLTLFEVDEAANRIRDEVEPEANIIFGSTFESSLDNRMRVSVVATGIDNEEMVEPRPVSLSLVTSLNKAASTVAASAPANSPVLEAPEPAPELHASEPEAPAAVEPLDPAARVEVEAPAPAPAPPADGFVAPPPMEPAPVPASVPAARMPEADAFAAADLINGARGEPAGRAPETVAPRRRKAQSLFNKVTGAARAFHEATQGSHQPAAQPAAQAAAQAAAQVATGQGPADSPPAGESGTRSPEARQTAVAQETPARVAAPPLAGGTAPAAPGQSRLTGLDPSDRLGVSPKEEDLLDIPAFLRRQAN